MKPSLANLRKKAAALADRIPLGRLGPQALSFSQQDKSVLGADGSVPTSAPALATTSARASASSGERARPAKVPLMASSTAKKNERCAPRPPRWAVALSGGADSVALLLLLWAHYPQKRGDLLVLHYNHRLRGAAADEDEAFCRELCDQLGVKLAIGQRPDRVELRSEAAARDARFAFFSEEMQRASAWLLWLGHQQNDVAETLLMRLVRGSGTGGLAAPRPVQKIAASALHGARVHLRPLLTLSRAEIEAALRDCGIPWREDATNAAGEFFRNRIRRDVLPALLAATAQQTETGERSAQSNRDALAGMSLSRELLDEDDAALDAWAAAVTKSVIRDGCINLRALNGALRSSPADHDEEAKALPLDFRLPRAVKRRVLYRWLRDHAGEPPLSRHAFESLLNAAELGKSTRQSLGKTGFALIRKHTLKIEPNSSAGVEEVRASS